MPRLDRHGVMTLLLLALGAFTLHAMLPVRVEPIIQLVLQKNASAILHLEQGRQVTLEKRLRIDRLDLSQGGRLRHPVLGDIGYGEHFFLRASARFRVLEAADYRFVVSSDDGFALRIDAQPLCAHPKARAMATQSCGLPLEAGEHTLELDYFQGGGPSGLTVQYARQDERRAYWIGEDSSLIEFLALPSP